MINIGDLVKRIAVLSVIDDHFGWVLTDDFPDNVGIVLSTEEPLYDTEEGDIDNVLNTGYFVEVVWQRGDYAGPVWHWSEELLIVNKITP